MAHTAATPSARRTTALPKVGRAVASGLVLDSVWRLLGCHVVDRTAQPISKELLLDQLSTDPDYQTCASCMVHLPWSCCDYLAPALHVDTTGQASKDQGSAGSADQYAYGAATSADGSILASTSELQRCALRQVELDCSMPLMLHACRCRLASLDNQWLMP
jgi:hypothetical protein